MDEKYTPEPLVSIEPNRDGPGFTVYQLGGPVRVALYGCTTRSEAEAFVAGMRANGGGAYAHGYALGRSREYARWVAMMNRCAKEPFEDEP